MIRLGPRVWDPAKEQISRQVRTSTIPGMPLDVPYSLDSTGFGKQLSVAEGCLSL